MPKTPEEIKQETGKIRQEIEDRRRRQEDAQTVQARTASRAAIADLLAVLHTIAGQIVDWRFQGEMVDTTRENWISRHSEFNNSQFSPSHTLASALVFISIYVAAYWLDVLLLSHNARLLVKDFAQNNQIIIYLAILGIPLVIIIMETYFQTHWATAQTTGQKWLWGSLSILMCLAIPATIVGFSMATSSAKAGTRAEAVENWQLIGKAVLAFFAHAAILLGGKRLHEAKDYLIYKGKDSLLGRRSSRLSGRVSRAEVNLTNRFTEYFRQFNAFNTAYPQNQVESGPFNQITRTEINRVFGNLVIAPPKENPPTLNTGRGTPNVQPPNAPNQDNHGQNNQTNENNFVFDIDGEDEVRP